MRSSSRSERGSAVLRRQGVAYYQGLVSGERLRADEGSGSVAAIAVVAVVVLLCGAFVPLAAAVQGKQRAANAADAAALAAADTVLGYLEGEPCANAGEMAVLNGAMLESCSLGAVEASVEVSVSVAGWSLSARARAGLSASTQNSW